MDKVEEGEENDVFCKRGDIDEDLFVAMPDDCCDCAEEKSGPRPCHD